MPDTEVMPTAEVVAPQEGASQNAPTGTQVQPEGSSATPTQVEGQEKASTQVETRPFERIAGRKFDKIEKSIRQLTDLLQQSRQQPQSVSTAPAQPSLSNEEFVKDPMKAIQQLMDARDQQLMGKIPQTLSLRDQEMQFTRSREDALKMIRTNETVKKDPEGIEKMQEILTDEEYNLDEIAKTHPIHAAKLALEIFNARYGTKKVQSAPTKAQMVSTATATNAGGGKMDIQAEAAQLQKELLNDPNLMTDPSFKAKMADLIKRGKQEAASQVQ